MSDPDLDATIPHAGVLLRRARRIARLSQREMAARAGIPQATVARIEASSEANPQFRTVAALLAAAGCRLSAVSDAGIELAAHPWERDSDYGGRHFPAHLDLVPVNPPYEPAAIEWGGWYRSWAWQPDAQIPTRTFTRIRNDYYSPPLDPATGRPWAPEDDPADPDDPAVDDA